MTLAAESQTAGTASPSAQRVLLVANYRVRSGEDRGKNPVRTLFVGSTTEVGGAETALLALFRSFDSDIVQPAFASLEFGEGLLPQRVEEVGVPVTRLTRGRMRNLRATIQKVRELVRLILDLRIDAVVANGGHPLPYARAAAWLTRRPCLWWVHQTFAADPLADGPLGALELALGADLLIANSRRTAAALRRHFQNCEISQVSPGVDGQAFEGCYLHRERVRKSLGFQPHEFVAGVFGRLQRNKGQHVALQALAELQHRSVPIKLLLVGGEQFGLDSGYQRLLWNYADAMGVGGSAKFLGERQDVPALLSACDVALQPAIVPESFGLTVVEAMAAGVPVIAAQHGGPLEIIEDGVTGFFHTPGDALSLANRMQELYQDDAARERIASAARCRAREFHFADRSARAFEDILWRLTQGSPARHGSGL